VVSVICSNALTCVQIQLTGSGACVISDCLLSGEHDGDVARKSGWMIGLTKHLTLTLETTAHVLVPYGFFKKSI